MSWGATSLVMGVASAYMSNKQQQKAAGQMSALSREAARKLRARAAESSAATKAEIRTLRAVRSLDMPALRAAGDFAMRKAQQGAERANRVRTLGSTTGEVREALFSGNFQAYIARESNRLGRFTQITQQILQATTKQQEIANDVEARAGGIEFEGEMAAIKAEQEAGDGTAQILAAVGSAASAFAQSKAQDKRLADKRAESVADDERRFQFMLDFQAGGAQ